MKTFEEAVHSIVDLYLVGTYEQKAILDEFAIEAKANPQFMRTVMSLTQSLLDEVKGNEGQKIVNKGAQSIWRAMLIGITIGRDMEKQDVEVVK